MEFDKNMILTSSAIGIIGFFTILIFKEKLPSNIFNAIRFLLGGLLILLFAVFGNNLIEGYQNINYVFDFLCLKKVGEWFFRASASLGYVIILWGLAMLIGITIKVKRN